MMQSRSTIRFWHRGAIRSLGNIDPIHTVLEWLREDEGLTGSKEGCAEGDCGTCTALMAWLENGELIVRPVNTCIVLLPMLDGSALFTVEDLADESGTLHPVQQAMVDAHGSQCGFCTPGIVMALAGLYHQTREPSRQQILDQLAGNLCRCTGYGPIVEAATMMGRLDPTRSIIPTNLADELSFLQDDQCLQGSGPDGEWFAPATIDDLSLLLEAHSDATIVAGATDVGLWVTKQLLTFERLIFLHRISDLRSVQTTDAGLEIGAMATYASARSALAGFAPALDELIRRFGSEQVRSFGTIGGNIANGSPIGDMPPALIAANAQLRLRSAEGDRVIALEDFFIDYGKQDRHPGEFVEAVVLPRPGTGWALHVHKLSKRFDQDISAVCGAFALTIVDGLVRDARIVFGGMAAIPRRALATETALIGELWNEDTVWAAMGVLEREFEPMTDQRGGADYRRIAARNLLWKVWLDTTDDAAAMSLSRQSSDFVDA